MAKRYLIALAAIAALTGCNRSTPSDSYQPPVQPVVQQPTQRPLPPVASVEQQLATAGLQPSDAQAFGKRYSQLCSTAKMTEMELMPVVTKLLHADGGNAKKTVADLELLQKYHKQNPKAQVWDNAIMVTMMSDSNFAPNELKHKTDAMSIYRKLSAR